MRHRKDKRKLGRNSSHRKALLRNMVRNLMIYEKIKTTLPKAKETKRLAERIITLAKDNNLKNKRAVYDILQDHSLTSRVFNEIAPRFKERVGGYTSIIPLKVRTGDGAQLANLSLVELRAKTSPKAKSQKRTTKIKTKGKFGPTKEKEVKEIKEKAPETKRDIQRQPKEEKKRRERGFLKNLGRYLRKTKRPEGS